MARILVIDDEEPIRTRLCLFLESLEHEVVQASDGAEGVRLFLEEPADLVITDIMVLGKYGLEVLREIRRSDPEVGVIVFSGYHPGRLSLARALGASYTFKKPVSLQELGDAVEEFLERGSRGTTLLSRTNRTEPES